jgi:hypothetical protein
MALEAGYNWMQIVIGLLRQMSRKALKTLSNGEGETVELLSLGSEVVCLFRGCFKHSFYFRD